MATKVIYFWQNVFSKISSVLVGHQPIPNNSISNIKVELLIKKLHTLAFESVEMVSASWSPMLCIEYMASLAGTTSEDSPGSSVAIAGHAARRMTAEGAAESSG